MEDGRARREILISTQVLASGALAPGARVRLGARLRVTAAGELRRPCPTGLTTPRSRPRSAPRAPPGRRSSGGQARRDRARRGRRAPGRRRPGLSAPRPRARLRGPFADCCRRAHRAAAAAPAETATSAACSTSNTRAQKIEYQLHFANERTFVHWLDAGRASWRPLKRGRRYGAPTASGRATAYACASAPAPRR